MLIVRGLVSTSLTSLANISIHGHVCGKLERLEQGNKEKVLPRKVLDFKDFLKCQTAP